MPYIPYTDEQKQLANSIDLPTFLRMRGEKLVPVGREFKLIYYDGYGKHDSITVSGSQWYDHKNQIGGGPIKFMREHYGMNFQEAMQALLGHSALPLSYEVQPVMAKEKKEFRLPEANDNMHRVYAYLIKQRFIAPEVITHFAKKKLLYEDKKHHNAVFVGVDSSGIPRQAHKRSTTTFGNSFRQTIEGSDTKYSFAHFGKSSMLFVFEAPIDMMSFLTLYPKDWEQHSYIAMNGVYESAVLTALEEHPNLTEIIICTDNDEGGIDAADRLADILSERGYDTLSRYPPNNKDWNEDLKELHGVPFLSAVSHRRLEEYERQAESLQYYPCRIEKLRSQLNAAFRNGQYRYLAEYALAGSVFFSQKTGSNSKAVGTRMIQDYELEFRGVATIVPKEGTEVPVLLWEIDQRDELSLDRYEGFPRMYRKELFEVEVDGKIREGMAYLMNYGEIAPPSPTYYNGIKKGYEANGMDTSYLRAALERAVYHVQHQEQKEDEEFEEDMEETDDFQMTFE